MALGALLAAVGLAPARGLPEGAVAVVGGTRITEADLQRGLQSFGTVDARIRRHVLDRLIDEAVLVERGLELGLARADRRVRADLAAAVLALVTARADAAEPDEATLRGFHAEHAELFRITSRLHLRARHRGATVELPEGPVPPGKLRDYLGPTLVDAALTLPLNQPTQVGDHELTVVARTAGAARPFEAVRPLVLATWRRRAADRALVRFLKVQRGRLGVVGGD